MTTEITEGVYATDTAPAGDGLRLASTRADVIRSWKHAIKVRRNLNDALRDRDAYLAGAMADGWTSSEIGAMVGIAGSNVRTLVYLRKNGRPDRRKGGTP